MPVRPFLLAGRPERSDRVHTVLSPWDGRPVAEVALAGPAHLERALAAAAEAAPRLAKIPAAERAAALERARELLRERAEELVQAVVHEAGKPITLARLEVSRALDTLTDAAWAARSLGGSVEPLDAVSAGAGKVGFVRRVPAGPVAAITPFNFPVNLVLHKLAPAWAAGCPVILKPAMETPTSALLLGELLTEAGLPEGALSVLPLEVGDADPLVTDPRLRVLSFTGSVGVGWALHSRARGRRVILELGGNAFNLVCEDADLDAAIPKLAAGGLAYAGQSCISVQNVLAHRAVYEQVVQRLADRLRGAVRSGDPSDPAVLVGPVIRASDADRIVRWIAEAVDGGARIVTGGGRSGNLVEPTLLVDLPEACRVVDGEVFGPVINVLPFDTLDEAFARVNRSRFGLQASIFTRDLATVLRAHAELDVGAVVHDEASAYRIDNMPYGGVKDSGLGREGPRHAVLEYTEPRMLVLRNS